MKKKIRLGLTLATVIIATQSSFAQKANSLFNQKAPASGSFIRKTMRSCFGSDVSNAKVIAVVNSADWCIVCQKNEERVATILPNYKTKPVFFVANDITDEHSKAISAKYLKKLRLYEAIAPERESGVMILLDAHSHQVISKISLSSSDQEIENAINNALTTRG